MCMEKDKNQTLKMVKMSITPPGKAEQLSPTSHMYQLTHNLHAPHCHTFDFNGDVPT